MVSLFADRSWSSPRLDLHIDDYIANRRQRSPISMVDRCNWVAWNLPLGTVVTFTDHVPWQPSDPASLAYAGGTFDLVGTGWTRCGSLRDNVMEDKTAAFWWREVDLWQGAVQLFQHHNFGGNFATIFLCEWPRDTPVDMFGWFLNDEVTSVQWGALTDRQTVTLYQLPNGRGERYENIKGWGGFKKVANLTDLGCNDTTSSFSWSSVNPKKEIIEPIILASSIAANSTSFTANNTGDNHTDADQSTVVTLKVEEAQTVTVETSDTDHSRQGWCRWHCDF
ncbi:MAG: hypothetical protein LQ342_006934 [Letrouitia transgressa]|nr:MAG: hypothetical protein LQ342_006934 [Letrouitia transgressa]